MSARMQFCGRFPGLRAVSGIWSGAAADSLSLGSKRSGCVGLHSTQPKHRRFETVRLSASRPSAGRSTQSPGTSAKLPHGRTRGAVSGGWKVKVKGVKVRADEDERVLEDGDEDIIYIDLQLYNRHSVKSVVVVEAVKRLDGIISVDVD